jgi:hypothetical protein
MNPKAIRIYLIIMGIIGLIMFAGLFLRSHKSSQKWIDMEITGQINDFVHIGKDVFIEVDSLWIFVSYNYYYEKNNPNECNFVKNKGERYYSIYCKNNLSDITLSSKGGIVEDKIWLRRIEIALQKKKKNH